MRFDILTIFPEMFREVLGCSILGIAQEKGAVSYHLHDIREYTGDKHRRVDDRPYGGGPGMVMMPGPVVRAVEAVEAADETPSLQVLLTPQGRTFDQEMAAELAQTRRIMLICGRYEGFDERIRLALGAEEVSIGDYVLSGGELPAMVIIDAVVRLQKDVLGHPDSALQDSFGVEGCLDFPQYTRPPEFRGMRVPDVLLSGNHQKIAEWRAKQAKLRTISRRSDMLEASR
ncbi:MAG: tRNA (guanosine(37)-N1)-methyltransferase TrmD [Planctomycetes bacterium]|nr:tRNA (guanosine(37)-N1)-methyltransferase TrmD [Planctomycetota bacterium]